jgi:hypothetical protein
VTLKASSLLSIAILWAAMIAAVIAEPDAWWALIFAGLATLAIGVSAWRRLGISRVVAIGGTWVGAAIAIGDNPGNAWLAIFAFLTTAVVVYSVLSRTAVITGAAIAVAWLATGVVAVDSDGDGAWICVFAFLTAAVLSNSRDDSPRGLLSMVWWGIAAGVMVAADGWYWLAVFAFLFSAVSLGVGAFRLPRGIEWDLFGRDDEAGPVR